MRRPLNPCHAKPSEIVAALVCWYTPRQIAQSCGVTTRQVYNWAKGTSDDQLRKTEGVTQLRRFAARVYGAECPDCTQDRPRLAVAAA